MGIDAIALVHCTRPELLERLAENQLGQDVTEQLKRVAEAIQRGEDAPLIVSLSVLGVGADYAKVYTGVRFHALEADRVYAQMLAHRVVSDLPQGAHEDARGLLFYPDAAELNATTYHEAVVELERGSIWSSTGAVAPETVRTWRQAQAERMGAELAQAAAKREL